ncbi:MAG: ABC transporter substrate-binding protein [Deltaproteobacteria bacterium]|nr:ABC transporter substrate-binding protein [Deltaproteobacteria bacterium]MBW2122421.1 ABC transporter substrate-binding protein [Deltaproteobacteria bacterium]
MRRSMFFLFFLCIVFAATSAVAGTTITVCSYGGTYNKGLEETIGKPFTKATGINVIFTTFPTYAQMEAQVKSGNIEWDIVECESRMYARGVKNDIFEPLDLSMIKKDDFVEGSATRYGVGLIYYSYNISYNTEKWPAGKGPRSMKDLWDVKRFPGPRTMKLTAVSNLEAALLADGVPRDKVYPIDVDRALRKMSELKPNIRVFWKSGGQSQQIMREGEADIGLVPGGRMIQLADQGVPVTWEWNDQLVVLDYWTILKGSKNRDAAMKFIAFASDPKRQAAFAEWTNYGPANKKAYDHIRKEKAVLMPTYPENLAKGLIVSGEWYAEHEKDVERRWEAWKME